MKPFTPALAHQVGDQSVHAFRVNLAISAPTRRVHRRFPLLAEENHLAGLQTGAAKAHDELLEGRLLSVESRSWSMLQEKEKLHEQQSKRQVWQPTGCVSCEPACVCVSLVRVVIICPASTHTALVSSPSLEQAVLHLPT